MEVSNEQTAPVSAPAAPSRASGSLGEVRWPALMAVLTAWWLPATTARRTGHLSLRSAVLVHLLCAPTAVALGVWLTSADPQVQSDLMEMISDCQQHPELIPLVAAAAIIVLEGGFLLLAHRAPACASLGGWR